MSLKRLVLIALWIALTIATSWYVARQVSSDSNQAISINVVAPVSSADREVVSLSENMVAPVISANAMMFPNKDDNG